MTRTRTPISLIEHNAIGDLLWQMEVDLIFVAEVVGPAYGARMMESVCKVKRALNAAQVALDTLFYHVHPSAFVNPYGGRDNTGRRDAVVVVRERAATIIEPTIAYDPPPPAWDKSRSSRRLTGPLLFREHLVIGKTLYQVRQDLTDLFINKLQKAYGKSHRTVSRVRSALAKLEALRCALDSKVCAEHPMSVDELEGVRITHAYYGGINRAPALQPVRRSFLASVAFSHPPVTQPVTEAEV